MNFYDIRVTRASCPRHPWSGCAVLAAALTLVLSASGCRKTPPPAEAPTPAAQPNGAAQLGSLADRLNKVMSGADKQAGTPLPDWKPIAPDAANPPIPLVKGLVVNTAISQAVGDYESFKTVMDISPATVHLQYKAATPVAGAPKPAPGQEPQLKQTACVRTIDGPDLLKAHGYNQVFCGPAASEHFPGSTAISASTEVLTQLRAGQSVDFYYAKEGIAGLLGAFTQKATPAAGGAAETHTGMTHCMLSRAEPTDAAFPVLLNGQPVVLPALHATCTPDDDGDKVTIYYLDQPANPLSLAWQINGSRLQVIRITLPPPAPPAAPGNGAGNAAGAGTGAGAGGGGGAMEAALAEKKPVEVYGIYFDFNSAVIKPESEVVLQQISDIMHKNPDWKLNVSGHTDNIGDGPFNEALSERRSAAVKAALVSRYGIAPERLNTAGYGASQPIDDNKTLEGRARNRRVELRRE